MSRAERDWAVNALSFVGASRPKLADLGFEVGKDLHNSVTDFVAGPIYARLTAVRRG